MSSPQVQPPAPEPPPFEPLRPAENHHAAVVAKVQRAQRSQLWREGALWGLSGSVALLVTGGFVGLPWPALGRLCMVVSPLLVIGTALAFGVGVALRRVGNEARTARWIGEQIPAFSADVLAAVELRRELDRQGPGKDFGFSPRLAKAFIQQLDERIARLNPHSVTGPPRTQRAALALVAVSISGCLAVAVASERWVAGTRAAWAETTQQSAEQLREPITGDVELTYRYPAYTGLSPRTVIGSSGEISALAGTEVSIKTRSDREVERAELELELAGAQGQPRRVALTVQGGRELTGAWVLDRPGSYRFLFLSSGGRVRAEGPPIAIHVEPDAAPQVRVLAPAEEVEIDPGQAVKLRYEASDDFGLSSLELVFTAPGHPEPRRQRLKHDDGRVTHGGFEWDLLRGEIKLQPGQKVTYYLEARDNDTLSGEKGKKGVSRTQVLKLYSAAEHRRAAVKRAEALWDKLVLHLADRLEAPEHRVTQPPADAAPGQRTDASGLQLASEFSAASRELVAQRDAPPEVVAALGNVADSLRRRVGNTAEARRLTLRLRARPPAVEDGRRLAATMGEEIAQTEKDVLYLESLLDREKLKDLKELAEQLQRDRRELASLIEQYQKTRDEALREQILQEIRDMRARIEDLMRRMSELSKGIRDEHLNQEALKQMVADRDMSRGLDEIERLMREGKTDEALAKLQELSLQVDEMMKSLEGADDPGAEQFPELAEKFQDFMDDLNGTRAEQERVERETQKLRERAREKMKERLAQRGGQLKEELLRKSAELKKDLEQVSADELNTRADQPLEDSRSELENVQNALKIDDFDLAAEAAARVERATQSLSAEAERQRQLDEMFKNPPDVRKQSRELAERMSRDAQRAQEISQRLQDLFPAPGSNLSEADQARLRELAEKQRSLERRGRGLEQKMDQMSQMAPVFGDDAREQMRSISERMGGAADRLEGRDPNRGHGEQRAALDQLAQFQKQMQQSKGRGRGKGLPLPMMAGRSDGWGSHDTEKVEIPEEDPAQAPREFRKDLLDAMKQGSPEKYQEQVKRYYEELVK